MGRSLGARRDLRRPRSPRGAREIGSPGVVRLRGVVAVTAIMAMAAICHARHHSFGVVLLAHARQLFEKANGCPQLLVTVIVPGGHAGHLDAVLDGPEKFGGVVELCCFGEIRGRGIKASRNVALRHAWRAVTDRAMGRVMLDADEYVRRIVEPGR